MNHGIGLVAGLHHLVELLVFLGMGLGVLDHFFDLFLTQPGRCRDLDALFLARGLVLGGHIENAVGVDIESHFDLRHATRRRRNVREIETPQGLVGGCHLPLALQHMHGHRGLVVLGGGEHLGRRGRNGGVLLDELGHHATHGLDTQGKRGNVQQQHVFDVARQHTTLDGRANGHRLIGVDVLARRLAEKVLHGFLNLGHAGLAANQDHVINLRSGQAGIGQGHLARLDGLVDELFHQGFQLGPGQLDVHVLGPTGISRDIGQIDVRLLGGRQFDLGFLGGFLETLQGQGIIAQIHALFVLEGLHQEVDDPHVEVLATKEGVTVGGQYLELMFAIDLGDLDDGYVKGTASQVVNHHFLVALALVHAIGQGRRRGLVDDALHIQAGNTARVLGGLTLGIVEIGRHGDYRLGDFLTQVILRRLLHLLQYLGGNLRRRHLLAVHFHPGIAIVRLDDLVGDHFNVPLHHRVIELAADESLDGEQGVVGIGHRLALGGLADQHLALLGVSHDGRCGAITLGVLDNLGLVALHDGDTGVGGTQVDANNSAHLRFSVINSLVTQFRYVTAYPDGGGSLKIKSLPGKP